MRAREVVAVTLQPGPAWRDIVAEAWDAGAVLFPVDDRLPAAALDALVARARPGLLVDGGGRTPLDGIPAEPASAMLIATSGTGGEPKLVELSRAAIEAAVAGSTRMLGVDPGAPWLACLPLAHVGGMLVVLRSVLTGAPVTILERFDPEAIAAGPDAAYTSLVPTMLHRLIDARVDLSRFRAILVGGAPLPPELREGGDETGVRFVETYGLTESCGGVVYDGRPFEATEVRLGPDDEIQLLGPTMMSGYRSETALDAWTADGWLRTGDAGSVGDDGHVRVEGRLDDLIITGGEKVWPGEVEAMLRDHPEVADLAVAGRPDSEWGQRVVAFVVPRDPQTPPTLDALRDHVADRLPRYKAPRELVLLDHLQRTASGKIRRSALPR